MPPRQQLVELLARRSARRGHFTLASGRESELYIDARLTTMHPAGLVLIGPLGLAIIAERGWDAQSVGGLTLGADPISYAISYASALAKPGERSAWVRAFTVRKEAKTHGTGKLVEGAFERGDRVVVVEDVITTGASALRAAEAVSAAGGEVLGVLALVDREEGGREKLEREGLEVAAMTSAGEIVARLGTRDDEVAG